MFIFSIGGTTYGMLEETVGFYALLAAAMVMAGMDTIVSSAIVLLGAGSGVLGSTINPFAVGAAVSSLPEGIVVNQGLIIFIGVILWISTLIISILFVRNYAKKVIAKKGSTILSLRERKEMEIEYIITSDISLGEGTDGKVIELMENAGIATMPSDESSDHMQPADAAFLGFIANECGPRPDMHITAIGYGAGGNDTQKANIVSAVIGEFNSDIFLESKDYEELIASL